MSNVYTLLHIYYKERRDSSTGRAVAFLPLPQEAIDMGSIPVFGLTLQCYQAKKHR